MSVVAPIAGQLHPIKDTPDPVFSQEMLGSGVCIIPDAGQTTLSVHAPMSGTALKIMPHAFIVHDGTHGVLVHVGIDTVNLAGKGFSVKVKDGDTLTQGQLIMEVDVATVSQGYNLATPIIVMESAPGSITQPAIGAVAMGDPIFDLP